MVGLGTALLVLAGSLAVGTAAVAQTSVPMEFPAPGTRWITRTSGQPGEGRLATYTVLEPGAFQGRAGFRVSDGIGVQFFERGGRNWFATVHREKERSGSTPHSGAFVWPLEVGKTWSSVYQFRDNQRNLSYNRVTTTWRVAAEEEVTVPAGSYKTLRLEGENNGNKWTTSYAPSIRLVVKEIHERKPGHPAGPARTVTEIVRHAGPGGDPWYSFGLEASSSAVRRGEGRRALAFYESAGKDFETRGMPLEAAEALVEATRVSRSIGTLQPGIRAGLKAIELLKGAPRNDFVLGDLANAYMFTGVLYRSAGNAAEAQRFTEEGAQLTPAFSAPGRQLFWAGAFQRALAGLSYGRRDFPAAAREGSEAVKQLEQYLATRPTSGFDQARRNGQRNLALALAVVGDAERQMGNTAAATTALTRRVQVARDLGATDLELGARNSLGYLAIAKGDIPEALRQLEEAKKMAIATDNPAFVMWASNGIGRAHFREGHFAESFEAYKQAVALAESQRGALQDAGLRSGYLEDKQEMYHGAVQSAVALRKPEEAFALAERARSRAFLDLLGSQTVLSKGKTRALVEEEGRLRARLAASKASAEEAGEDDAEEARADSEAAEQDYREFLDRVRKENLEQASLMSVEPVNVRGAAGAPPRGNRPGRVPGQPAAHLAWVVSRTSLVVVPLAVSREELVAEVRAFRRGIEGQIPLPEAQKLAEALHERLLRCGAPAHQGHSRRRGAARRAPLPPVRRPPQQAGPLAHRGLHPVHAAQRERAQVPRGQAHDRHRRPRARRRQSRPRLRPEPALRRTRGPRRRRPLRRRQRPRPRRRDRGARQVPRRRRAPAPLRHPRRAQRGGSPRLRPPPRPRRQGRRPPRGPRDLRPRSPRPARRPLRLRDRPGPSSAPATSSSACSAPSSTPAPPPSSPRSGRSTTAPASCSCASSTTASPRSTPASRSRPPSAPP